MNVVAPGGNLRSPALREVSGNIVPLADQAMVSAANFLTTILLVHSLGLGGFGMFSLAWLVVLFVASLQFALISAPMMSIGPKQEAADAPTYFGAVFLQQAVFAALSFFTVWSAVSAGAVLFPAWGIAGLALPLAAAATAYQVRDFLRRYFFTRGRKRAALSIDAVSYIGQIAVLGLLFAASRLSIPTALWAIAGTSALSVSISAFVLERLALHPDRLRVVLRRHWLFSKWITASTILQWASGHTFIIVTGALLGPGPVGALRSAQNLMGVAQVIYLGLQNTVPVRAGLELQEAGVQALKRYLLRVSVFGLVATVAAVLVFAAAPAFWLRLLFGEDFVHLGWLVRSYAVVYVLIFLNLPLSAALRALECTRPIFFSALGTVVVGIVGAYPLVQIFGLGGVIMGLLIIQVVALSTQVAGLLSHLRGQAEVVA